MTQGFNDITKLHLTLTIHISTLENTYLVDIHKTESSLHRFIIYKECMTQILQFLHRERVKLVLLLIAIEGIFPMQSSKFKKSFYFKSNSKKKLQKKS